MTKKEALVATLQVSVPDISLEKAMIDQAITGTDVYASTDEKDIDLCAIKILQGLLAVPNISEGGMSISYDREGIQAVLLLLAKKHSISEVVNQYKPSVTGKSVW
jgi:hypothetical protein